MRGINGLFCRIYLLAVALGGSGWRHSEVSPVAFMLDQG